MMRLTSLVILKPASLAVVFALMGATPAPQASASTVTSPVSATTTMGEAFENGSLLRAFDQSGLSIRYASGVTDFDTYIASQPRHTSFLGSDWVSQTTAGVADFNFGSVLVVDRVVLWNFGVVLDFAISRVSLVASADAAFTHPVALGTFDLAIQPNPNPAQAFSFTPTEAQYIRFQDFVANGGNHIVLGEVAFGVVPEPATAWLAGLGLLGAGALIARREGLARALARQR